MAAPMPMVASEVKVAPVLSISQKWKALAKPKRKKTGRNILVKPYDEHWPKINEEEEARLLNAFERFIDEENKILGMKRKEKKALAAKRKRWSENLAFGINDVARCVKYGSLVGVLLAADVDPKFLIQHVITLCGTSAVPVLLVSSLRMFVEKLLGFSSIAIGIKKIVAESTTNCLHDVYSQTKQIAEHYKPPASISQFAEATDESSSDSESELKKPSISLDQTLPAVTPATDVYLYRSSKASRVFVPASQKVSEASKTVPKQKLEDFVSLGADSDSDESMRTQGFIKGISHCLLNNPQKRKMDSSPQYVPFKYVKVQPNPNKKQH